MSELQCGKYGMDCENLSARVAELTAERDAAIASIGDEARKRGEIEAQCVVMREALERISDIGGTYLRAGVDPIHAASDMEDIAEAALAAYKEGMPPMPISEIKPCPFCGAECKVYDLSTWAVWCVRCKYNSQSRGYTQASRKYAIAAHNAVCTDVELCKAVMELPEGTSIRRVYNDEDVVWEVFYDHEADYDAFGPTPAAALAAWKAAQRRADEQVAREALAEIATEWEISWDEAGGCVSAKRKEQP